MKYPIKKEFFPYMYFKAPTNKLVLFVANKFLKVPSFIYKDKELDVKSISLNGYKEETFKIHIIRKKGIEEKSPVILMIHGGGFIFEGFKNHFRLASEYVKACSCVVVYVQYQLAPKYPFPYQQEECYLAYKYLIEHAEELNIDLSRFGVTGDSAGGTLAVTSMLLARERKEKVFPCFQLLVYPWLDRRNQSESFKKYNDTPMWNSSLTLKSKALTNPSGKEFETYYISPVEYEDLSFLPPAYIEVAQYDCLHDDGVLYASLLKDNGIEAELYEIEGTMHGYECKYNSETMIRLRKQRIAYIKNKFNS